MDTALKVVKMLALLSVVFVCCAVGYEALQVRPVVTQLSTTLQKTGAELDALSKTNDILNKEWLSKTGRLQQTVDQLQYVILQIGTTSKKESDSLTVWNAEISHTLADLDAAVVTGNSSIAAISSDTTAAMRQVNATVANVNPALNQAAETLRQSQLVIEDAHTLLADPSVTATLSNTRDATKHLSDTAGDVEGAVHEYLHPGWKTKVFNWSMTVVHALGGWF
jgi:methyl-accepting chemotaxis protein